MADFLILDKTSNYNIILGRGILNEIKSAIFTYHLVMRFPPPPHASARFCHFVAITELRLMEVFAIESEQRPIIDLPTVEKLEIDTLDPRDKKKMRGEPM